MQTYLLKAQAAANQRYAFIGIPHDAASSLGNPGARFAPEALRTALRGVFAWRLQAGKLADVDRGIIDLSRVEVADAGDVDLPYADTNQAVEASYAAVKAALAAGYFPLIVGGDHGISYPAIKALHDTHAGPIGLIQLDAHMDLMDHSHRQGAYSGSSGMRRSLELAHMRATNLVQIGLRGYSTVEQYSIGQEAGVRRISAMQCAELGPRAVAEQALAWASDGTSAIYLTVDMDVFNPGEAPGTGWPEPGGLTAHEVSSMLRLFAPALSAMDIAELNPLYDTGARTTTLLAARLMLDVITTRVGIG